MCNMQNMVNWLVNLETKTAHDIYTVAGKIASAKGNDKDVYYKMQYALWETYLEGECHDHLKREPRAESIVREFFEFHRRYSE